MSLKAVSAAPAQAANVTVGSSVITGGATTQVLYQQGSTIGESSAFTFTTASGTLAATALVVTTATASGKILAGNYDCSGSTPPTNGWTVPAASTVSLYTAGVKALTLGPTQSVIVGTGAALATAATDGFLYITTVTTAPTGTPSTAGGRVPMVYDTANNKFYIYNGGWVGATLS